MKVQPYNNDAMRSAEAKLRKAAEALDEKGMTDASAIIKRALADLQVYRFKKTEPKAAK